MVMSLTKLTAALMAIVLIGIVWASIGKQAGAQGEIGDQGLSTIPAGQEVLYMFSGVVDEENTPKVTTRVYCTNHGSAAVDVTVQMFNESGAAILAPGSPTTVNADQTVTFQPSQLDGLETQAGSGRVMAPSSANAQVICTVQVRDMENTIPSFVTKLHLFDSAGNCVGAACGNTPPGGAPPGGNGIFMPIIVKNS
jgi:hypothetical protein